VNIILRRIPMEKVIIKIGDSEFEVKLTKEQIQKIEESGK